MHNMYLKSIWTN